MPTSSGIRTAKELRDRTRTKFKVMCTKYEIVVKTIKSQIWRYPEFIIMLND